MGLLNLLKKFFNNQDELLQLPEQNNNENITQIISDSNINLKVEINDHSDKYWEERFKEIRKLTEKSYPSLNGLKIPEIMVLDYAETFTTEVKDIRSFWYYQYGLESEEVKSILDKLLDKKLIRTATAKETIKKFTVAKIKECLKESGLKQTGRKAELLERLFINTSDEYLESKVTEKSFALTDAGKQELKENDYVIYFHKFKGFMSVNFDVWQINKKLHDNPEKTYREIMWDELQKQYNTARHELYANKYKLYTIVCTDICTFLLESEGNAETALKYFAESSYYEINYNMMMNYNSHIEYYKIKMEAAKNQKLEFTEVLPEIYEFAYIDEKNFNNIQSELDISDDEICKKLENIFFGFNAEKTLLSDIDTAKFIIARVRKDYETLCRMNYIY